MMRFPSRCLGCVGPYPKPRTLASCLFVGFFSELAVPHCATAVGHTLDGEGLASPRGTGQTRPRLAPPARVAGPLQRVAPGREAAHLDRCVGRHCLVCPRTRCETELPLPTSLDHPEPLIDPCTALVAGLMWPDHLGAAVPAVAALDSHHAARHQAGGLVLPSRRRRPCPILARRPAW